MAHGRLRTEWDQTAGLLYFIANMVRDPKKPPVKYSVFHPYLADPQLEVVTSGNRLIEILQGWGVGATKRGR